MDGKACEDGYFINEDYVVVVDGATSRGKYLWNNKTSGEYAKDLIISAIGSFDGKLSCEQFFDRITEAVRESYADKKEIPISERLRASVIVYSGYYKEIWVLGDCQCKINGMRKDTGKMVDFYISEIRSMLIRSFLAEGMTEEELLKNDLSRKMIEPIIDRQFFLENQKGEFGYPVMNGVISDHHNIIKYKVKDGDVVILATDGYPILEDDLSGSEAALKELMEKDPLCYKIVKSTKGLKPGQNSFDDRCFIKFEV